MKLVNTLIVVFLIAATPAAAQKLSFQQFRQVTVSVTKNNGVVQGARIEFEGRSNSESSCTTGKAGRCTLFLEPNETQGKISVWEGPHLKPRFQRIWAGERSIRITLPSKDS